MGFKIIYVDKHMEVVSDLAKCCLTVFSCSSFVPQQIHFKLLEEHERLLILRKHFCHSVLNAAEVLNPKVDLNINTFSDSNSISVPTTHSTCVWLCSFFSMCLFKVKSKIALLRSAKSS